MGRCCSLSWAHSLRTCARDSSRYAALLTLKVALHAQYLRERLGVLRKRLSELRVRLRELLEHRLDERRVLLHQLAEMLDLGLVLDGGHVDAGASAGSTKLWLAWRAGAGSGLLSLLLLSKLKSACVRSHIMFFATECIPGRGS